MAILGSEKGSQLRQAFGELLFGGSCFRFGQCLVRAQQGLVADLTRAKGSQKA